jgi:6-phosphogluconolactonase
MPYWTYVSLQGDDKILCFALDPATGRIEAHGETAAPGAPGPLTIDPSGRCLYAARRGDKALSSYRIDPASGRLDLIGVVELLSDPPFLFVDRGSHFLLSSYYSAGHVAVHSIGADGAVNGPPIEWIATATGAHSVQTDPSNRFAFLPHIADRGPNEIRQFRFDALTGHLTPNDPPKAVPPPNAGPRHFCFHPRQNIVYFCNEQGCSVTAYRLDRDMGNLSAFQTISTLPEGYSGRNSCAEIRITPSGNFVYASNRGHDSIACYAADPEDGHLLLVGHAPTEAVPRAFSLDPSGTFLFAAGQESGRLAAYRIDQSSGILEPLATYAVGARPIWVLITRTNEP